MDRIRYPPAPSYPSNQNFPLRHSNYTLPAPSVTPRGQTTTPDWNTDTKPHRSLGVRTPSPTLSEAAELSRTAAFDWKRLAQRRFWFRREWLWYYIALVLICTVTTLVTLYHQEIVDFLRPAADWIHEFPAGFVIPIAILFVISFPPLFGHEIIAILCGLVWGLWPGFGIVCAGTFLGEVGNFYAFKYCCRSRGEKLERSNLTYACLAKVVRDGGFVVALIARLSAIPVTTAVFSTCGMNILVFSLAALLSLPKQFITVYLGVALEQASNGAKSSTQDNLLKYSIIAVTLVITVWAMWYIYTRMGQVKTQVIYERRKARQMTTIALDNADIGVLSHSVTTSAPLPVRPDGTSEGRRWEEHGNAVGWSGNCSLKATEHESRLVMDEERDTLGHGEDFTVWKHHHPSHSTGPRMHEREAFATRHQHIRTRSFSGFHREATIDNSDTFGQR